ncbi:MAG: helix-turn-helix transcriptional regulator [Prevotella sp.]|nr:helix-turn-helix transcriptional regulator [Prevotella sp.]
MLGESKMSVNEVAAQLGFNYSNHFTRFFRNLTGKTPSEFRQAMPSK